MIRKYTGPDPYLDGIILRSADNIGRVTVAHHERRFGSSNYTFGKLVSLWGSVLVAYSLYPLRLLVIDWVCDALGSESARGRCHEDALKLAAAAEQFERACRPMPLDDAEHGAP